MNCRIAESLISPYLDGELTGAQMSQMRSHLAGCLRCQMEVEEYRALKSLLAVSSDMMPTDEVHVRMMAGMEARAAKMDRKAWMTGLAAVASAFALYAAIVTASHINHTPQTIPVADNYYNAESDRVYSAGADPYTNHVQGISVGLR